MNVTLTGQVEHLVIERTGLKLRPRQREVLQISLNMRIRVLNVRDEDEYSQLLKDDGLVAEGEWQHIARLLTNKESYFFRDKGQMALLRDFILPELIERNRSTQTLRIWSAGCSTGEEAYTLAILLDGLLPKQKVPSWKITIIGTDIDSAALEHARRGIYSHWSFRMVDPATKQRYFRHRGGGWQVLEPYHSSVVFKSCNLVANVFPSNGTGLYEMDLILCRNVFIYFEPNAVAKVLDKFSQTLRPEGYLMTGHVETRGLAAASFNARNFPESTIYQNGKSSSAVSGKHVQASPPPVGSVSRSTLRANHKLETSSVAAVDTSGLHPGLGREQSLLLAARSSADLGHYADAVESCRELTREFPFFAEPYELLASIAQEQGREEEARAFLKKAIYLAPEAPYFYMELGALYRDEGDSARAHKMHRTALELLRKMPSEAAVGFFGGPNARECIRHLTELHPEGA